MSRTMWETRYLGQSLQSWAIAAGFALAVFVALQFLRSIVARRLMTQVQASADHGLRLPVLIANLVNEIRIVPLLIFSLYLSTVVLDIPPRFDRLLDKVIILMFTIQSAFWINRIINFWLERLEARHPDESGGRSAMVGVLGYLLRMVVWIIIILISLNNLGVNISALVAGFGIGGVAVALAVQNILGDLFASLTIVLDKPFSVGDSISVDNLSGTIEKIGLKTTRLRADSGEQLIFSNTDLLKSRIRNFKRMSERHATTVFMVGFETSPKLLRQVPEVIKEVIQRQAFTRFDGVHLTALTDGGLKFEASYTLLDPSYTRYQTVRQEILLEAMDKFQQLGITPSDKRHLRFSAETELPLG